MNRIGTVQGRFTDKNHRAYRVDMIADAAGKFTRSNGTRYNLVKVYL